MITIEPATLMDVPAIRRVLSETWRDTYSALLPMSTIDAVTSQWHAPNVLHREIENDAVCVFVARSSEGDVVGVLTASECDDVLHIERLYVLPDSQRCGLGRKLLEACCRASPDARRMTLEVEAENPKAQAFYHGLGFEVVGRGSEEVSGTTLHTLSMSLCLE